MLVALALLTTGGASAATLELRLLSPEGSPISGIAVAALPEDRPGAQQALIDCGASGVDGRAICVGLPVGRSTLRLTTPRGSDFVTVGEIWAPSLKIVTVSSADETLRLDLPIPRADQVTIEIQCDKCGAPWALEMQEEGSQTRQVVRRWFGDRPKVPLTQGRWHLTVTSPQGHLLNRLEVDGVEVQGATAVIDVGNGGRGHLVSWQFFAPAKVSGKVHWDVGPDPPCVPRATLIAAGPAFTAALARGGVYSNVFEASISRFGDYSLTLPDGRWLLTCDGPKVASVTPQSVTLDLVVGGIESRDFEIVTKSLDKDPASLTVRVTDPGQAWVDRVVVELWKLGESPDDQQLIQRNESMGGRRAVVSFDDVAEGSYRVAAGSVRGGEVSQSLRVTRGDKRTVDLELPGGAALRATLQQPQARHPVNVELTIEASPPPAKPLLLDPALRAARDKRTPHFDATGKLEEVGLGDGTYRLSARVVDSTAPEYFVEIVQGETHSREPVSLTLGPHDSAEIVVRLVAASQLIGTLHCDRNGQVPRRVEVRTLASDAPPPAETAAPYELDSLAAATFYASVLTGDHLDELRIGPLDAQKTFVVLRPVGFSRWTWVSQTEDPTRASPVWLQPDTDYQLGPITLDCAPSLKLLPRVLSGQPLPDLSHLRALVETRRLPHLGFDTPPGDWFELIVETHPDFARVRGLPVGRSELRARFTHPFFVPAEATLDPAALTRQASLGNEATLALSIGAIGGAVSVKSEHAALRITSIDGSVHSSTGENLPAGRYVVQACADDACTKPGQTWKDVVVRAGEWVELP